MQTVECARESEKCTPNIIKLLLLRGIGIYLNALLYATLFVVCHVCVSSVLIIYANQRDECAACANSIHYSISSLSPSWIVTDRGLHKLHILFANSSKSNRWDHCKWEACVCVCAAYVVRSHIFVSQIHFYRRSWWFTSHLDSVNFAKEIADCPYTNRQYILESNNRSWGWSTIMFIDFVFTNKEKSKHHQIIVGYEAWQHSRKHFWSLNVRPILMPTALTISNRDTHALIVQLFRINDFLCRFFRIISLNFLFFFAAAFDWFSQFTKQWK